MENSPSCQWLIWRVTYFISVHSRYTEPDTGSQASHKKAGKCREGKHVEYLRALPSLCIAGKT